MKEGTYWFKRFVKDLKHMNRHIRIKRINYGFYRIYFNHAYLGECYKDMPQYGYDIEEKNIKLISKKYAERKEDVIEKIRKVKNFVEGYWESRERFQTKYWMYRHSKEFNKTANDGYKQMVIK